MFIRQFKIAALLVASMLGGVLANQVTEQTVLHQQIQKVSNPPIVPRWSKKLPAEYLGYESCRKCHQQQIDKLVTTPHFKSFETMHRSAEAKQICKQLGIRSVKRTERCVRCHYTPEVTSRGVKAQSGISCESCHGPSQNWVKGHNDYGGLTVKRETETREHKQWRIEASIAAGMRHPANLYLLARSCYDCHLVDDAQLVNQTEHTIATPGFNMVAWSQGGMRHNFFRTDGVANEVSSPQRLRVMFIIDLMTNLEYTLNAVAISPADTRHHQAMVQQLDRTTQKVKEVAKLVDNDSVSRVLETISTLAAKSTSGQQKQVAQVISEIAFEFSKNESQHSLEAIQPMLPKPEQYR